MNMKKSIAGVMAGAMAVSAMATTVSAFDGSQEQIVLSYDLYYYNDALTDSTVTLTYAYADHADGYKIAGLDATHSSVKAKMGAPLWNDIYDLKAAKLSANGFPTYDSKGNQVPGASDTWSFALTSDNKNAYSSAVDVAVTYGSDKVLVDDKGNAAGIMFDFTTDKEAAGKVGVGGFVMDGEETEKVVSYKHKVDADAAAAKEPVYNYVYGWEEETFTDKKTDKKYTWADGVKYDAKTGKYSITIPGEAEKVDTKDVTYTSKEITAVAFGGHWVLAVGTGDNMKYFINAPQPGKAKDDMFTTDASKVSAAGQYATAAQAEAAKAAADDTATTEVKTLTVANFKSTINLGATSNEAGYELLDTKGNATGYFLANPTKIDIAAWLKDDVVKDAFDGKKSFNDAIAKLAAAGMLTTEEDAANVLAANNTTVAADAELAAAAANLGALKYVAERTPAGIFEYKTTITVKTPATKDTTFEVWSNNDGDYRLSDTDPRNGKGNFKTEIEVTAEGYGFKNYTVELTYNVGNTIKGDGSWAGTWTYSSTKQVIDVVEGTTDASVTYGAINKGTYASPMRSNYNKPANVIDRLTAKGYTYPQAVLNDVIANNEEVAFTFTTCSKHVDNRDYVKAIDAWTSDNGATYRVKYSNPVGGTETKNLSKADVVVTNGAVYVKNQYRDVAYTDPQGKDFNGNGDWFNPYFTQALYQNWTWAAIDGADLNLPGSGYYPFGPNGSQTAFDLFGSYSDGWNKELLAAGLVVNSAWTMQLSDTQALSWGENSITFFWNTITGKGLEDALKTNAKNFVTSLQLYTPVEWYWEQLDVSVGAAISEDVVPGAGLEEDAEEVPDEEEVIEEDVIEEDDVVEDDFVEDDFEEDVEEDVEEEDVVEDETFEDEDFSEDEEEFVEDDVEGEEVDEEEAVEEAEEVESPKTGNAPIALAVIPVALAAAAVIAKKRS